MALISLSAQSVMNIEPHKDKRITVELDFNEGQLMEAVETLVENLSSAQRWALQIRLDQVPA